MKLVRQWTIEIEMQCITMNYNEFELPRAPKRQSNSLYNVGTSCSELPDFDLSVDGYQFRLLIQCQEPDHIHQPLEPSEGTFRRKAKAKGRYISVALE